MRRADYRSCVDRGGQWPVRTLTVLQVVATVISTLPTAPRSGSVRGRRVLEAIAVQREAGLLADTQGAALDRLVDVPGRGRVRSQPTV